MLSQKDTVKLARRPFTMSSARVHFYQDEGDKDTRMYALLFRWRSYILVSFVALQLPNGMPRGLRGTVPESVAECGSSSAGGCGGDGRGGGEG
ncbi:unnamed protein product, partial [Iphiclides podalirius]